MHTASTLTAIGMALCMAAPAVQAVGFGRVSNTTQLGQPLNFAAAVRLEPDELLPRECVAAEVQSGDNKLNPAQIRVTLEGPADSVDRSVRVTTSALIDEPVVTVSVTLGCTAKITRRFVAFIDPPPVNGSQTVPVENLPPQRLDSQVAPLVALVQGEPRAVPPARARPERGAAPRAGLPSRPVAVASGDAVRDPATPRADKPARAARPPKVARAASSGPRLQLDPMPPMTASAAPTAASAPPTDVALAALASATALAASSAAPAASSAPPSPGSLTKERERIQSLEEGMAKLRSDSQATQAALAALQARLAAAESERYANPLVYTLAWLSALLAVAVAALWWRQARARQSAQWWAGPAPAPAASNAKLVAAPVEPPVSVPQPLDAPHTAADAFGVSTVIDEQDAPAAAPPTQPAPFAASLQAPVAEEPTRELSVEELIDLEQQAEFFVVLGQDDAAIELLMSHVRSDGGISPLPYLKLLEIYRRLGDQNAYERIRDRFNRRFNSYAPDWESDLQQGRSLTDYPETITQLQQLWSTPARAMETLDASLFRRHKTDETFDLPAYRELLFLYSIARDLAEHAGVLPTTSVDLLLPLGEPGEEPIARLNPTTQPGELHHGDMLTSPLDLDVSFSPEKTEVLGNLPSSGLRRPIEPPHSAPSGFVDLDLDLDAIPEPRKPAPRASGKR